MQEALHRLDGKVSHIYHKCNALGEKADGLAINQAVHMKMVYAPQAVSVPPTPSPVAAVTAAEVATPEPLKKKPRLLTLYYSPASLSSPQTVSSAASSVSLKIMIIQCIQFLYIIYTKCMPAPYKFYTN